MILQILKSSAPSTSQALGQISYGQGKQTSDAVWDNPELPLLCQFN